MYLITTDFLNIRKEPNGERIGTIRPNTICYVIGDTLFDNGILWANILTYIYTGEWVTGYSVINNGIDTYLESWYPHVNLGFPYKEKTYLTQMFGENPTMYRTLFNNPNFCFHNGIDFVGTKKQIYAIAPGIVTTGYDANGYGYWVRIEGETLITIYAHLEQYSVYNGAYLNQGDYIGIEGNTGGSKWGMANHLHIDIRNKLNYNENNCALGRIDPLPYINWNLIMFPTYVNILNR